MLIKRNVYFSAVDQETGEERLFSVNEIMTEDEYLERMYSEEQGEFGDKPKKKNLIGNQSSYRGNGRAYVLGNYGGVIGRAAGNHAATKAARQGKSDEEVMDRGKKVAGRVGGAAGAGLAAGATYIGGKKYLELHGKTVKDLGHSAQKAVGGVVKKINTMAAEKGNKKLYKLTKTAMQKIGKASGSKVGKGVAAAGIAASAAANGALAALGARTGVKKAIKERTEKAQTERDNR
jgi:hypothetical protein